MSNFFTINASDAFLFKMQFNTKARLGIYEKLSSFLKSDIPIDRTLIELSDEYLKLSKTNVRGRLLGEWYKSLEQGLSLSEALSPWIPATEAMLIKSGEDTGKLVEAFENCILTTESASKMKSALISSITYPTILILFLFIIIYGFSVKAVPVIASVSSPDTWPSYAKPLYSISVSVQNNWYIYLIFLFTFIVVINYSVSRATGLYRKHLDKLPPYNIYRSFQSSTFLIALSAMMKTGIPLVDAMRSISGLSTPYVKFHIENILKNIEQGKNVGRSLNDGFLDTETGIDVEVYSRTTSIDVTMEKIGKSSIVKSIESITAISGVINLLAVFSIVLFIAYGFGSFYMLINSLSSQTFAE